MDQAPVLAKSCPHCECPMPGTAAFCPGCGRHIPEAPRSEGRVGFLAENIAGALAYLTFLPAIIFLLVEPYRKNRWVRFHAFQCLFVCGAAVVMASVLRLLGLVLFMIPVLGPLLVVVIDTIAILGVVLLWMVLVIKAVQGQMLSLPLLGDFAERYADPL